MSFSFAHEVKFINDDILKPTILIQYLNNKLFNIKAEGTVTMLQKYTLPINFSHNYTLNAIFI